jgi:RNase adaptor protein for sRNA GlmZ degradation
MSERRGKYVRIQHYNPTRRRLLILLSIVGVLAFGWGTYTLALKIRGQQWRRVNRERDVLKVQVVQLEAQRASLLKQLAQSQQATEVELQASRAVKQDLAQLEGRILKLNEELSFYKSIVSPSQTKRALFIHKFRISAGEGAGKYNYKLVLMQVRSHNKVVRGEVNMKIAGEKAGKHVTLSLRELSAQESDTLSFSFKYFQTLEGDLMFPVGFNPSNLHITVIPATRKLDTIKKSYAWSEALTGGI